MRGVITLAMFVSIIIFPWPFSAALAFVAAFSEPLIPLAAGIFADTLFFVPHASALPLFTLYGAVVTIIATFVHSRLRASIIRK